MSSTTTIRSTARDFDFLLGSWHIHNRRLRERLAGSSDWEEFEATSVARPLLDGTANEDEFRTDHEGGFIGMSFRFFDAVSGKWSIYWADSSRCGILGPPVFGTFDGDVGVFEEDDMSAGRPILVRFLWSGVTTSTPRWEQAFSPDGGESWEPNWVMEFTPAEDTR